MLAWKQEAAPEFARHLQRNTTVLRALEICVGRLLSGTSDANAVIDEAEGLIVRLLREAAEGTGMLRRAKCPLACQNRPLQAAWFDETCRAAKEELLLVTSIHRGDMSESARLAVKLTLRHYKATRMRAKRGFHEEELAPHVVRLVAPVTQSQWESHLTSHWDGGEQPTDVPRADSPGTHEA